MIKFNEELMAMFCCTVLRTSVLAQDLPDFMFKGMKKYLHDTFYPSLSQQDIDDINIFITTNKDVIQTSMMQGFMTNTEGGKNALESVKGLLGLGDKQIEDLKKLQFKAMKSNKKIDKKTIEEMEKTIREGMNKNE